MKSSLFLLILLLTFFTRPLIAETHSLKEIILLSRENNPTIMAAENDLLSAENDLVGPVLIENSALTAKSDWNLSDDLMNSLSLNVPVIDQLSLSSSLDSDQNITAGITLKPLNMTTDQVDSQVKWDNAQNSLTYFRSTLDWEVLERVLALTVSKQENELYEALVILENEQYQASHALYLAGEVTYDNYLEALDDLTSAEENSLNSQEALQEASRNLWTYLGMSESFDLEPVGLESVENLANELVDIIENQQNELALSLSVLTARNALLQAEEALDTTLWFHPDLSVSANVEGSLDSTTAMKSSLSISLTLSGDSFNGTKRTILEAEKKETELALSQSLFESRLEKESLLSTLELAQKALDLAIRDEERSRILAAETELLHERGERTILEKREADLTLTESEIRVYERAAALVKAGADFLVLYPDLTIDILMFL